MKTAATFEPRSAERDAAVVRALLDATGSTQDRLLPLLLDVQAQLGFVPADAIAPIAAHFNLSRADVHGVVTFYQDLRTAPHARSVVQICQAEACQAVGCRALTRHAERRLGIALGEATADGSIAIEAAYCFGNCACGPTVRVGDAIHGRVDPEKLDALLAQLQSNASPLDARRREAPP